MKKFLVAVAVLLSLCSSAFAKGDAPLISLWEDSSGHGMRTRELTLRRDGTVILESYDFYKAPKNEWHVITVIRKVSPQEVTFLTQQASSLVASLPKAVDEKRLIQLDPESKAIRVRFKGSEFLSGWSSYQNAPPSDESKAFQDIWKTIEASLTSPGT